MVQNECRRAWSRRYLNYILRGNFDRARYSSRFHSVAISYEELLYQNPNIFANVSQEVFMGATDRNQGMDELRAVLAPVATAISDGASLMLYT